MRHLTIIFIVLFICTTQLFSICGQFHSVKNLSIHFHQLDNLVAPNSSFQALDSPQQHQRSQAHCLLEQLIGSRGLSDDCLPQPVLSPSSSAQNTSQSFSTLSQSLSPSRAPKTQSNSLVPLFAVDSSPEISNVNNFLSSTTAPPYGNFISLSFELELSVIQPPTYFSFRLRLDSTSRSASTRIHVESNSYAMVSTSYSGETFIQGCSSPSKLVLTILKQGKFEAILTHNASTYTIQQPDLIVPTLENIIHTHGAANNTHLLFQSLLTSLNSSSTDSNSLQNESDKPLFSYFSKAKNSQIHPNEIRPLSNLFFSQQNDDKNNNHISFQDVQRQLLHSFASDNSQYYPKAMMESVLTQVKSLPQYVATDTALFSALSHGFECGVEEEPTSDLQALFVGQQHADTRNFSHSQFRPQLVGFQNCIFDAQNKPLTEPVRVHIGFVVDTGAYMAMSNDTGLISSRILAAIQWANSFYTQQLGVVLTLDFVTIKTDYSPTDSSPEAIFNNPGPNSRFTTPNNLLVALSQYRQQTLGATRGVLGLITNHFPPPGVVGLAWTKALGLSYHSSFLCNLSNFWALTMAHELLHVFAAVHTFNDGDGSIMSYDTRGLIGQSDPDNVNEVGIHAKLTIPVVCRHLTDAYLNKQRVYQLSARVPASDYISSYSGAVCGNGIVENGEECDAGLNNGLYLPGKSFSCCNSACMFTHGSTCAVTRYPSLIRSLPTPSPDTTEPITPFFPISFQPTTPGPVIEVDSQDVDGFGPASMNSACCVDCQAQSASTSCQIDVDGQTNKPGYCGASGQCLTSGCFAAKYAPCDDSVSIRQAQNPCIEVCRSSTQSSGESCLYDMDLHSNSFFFAGLGSSCLGTDAQTLQQFIGHCVFPQLPPSATLQRPIPGANYISPETLPQCQPVQVAFHITDDTEWTSCGCDGYSTKKMVCAQNNATFVSMSYCLKAGLFYPPGSYLQCTPSKFECSL